MDLANGTLVIFRSNVDQKSYEAVILSNNGKDTYRVLERNHFPYGDIEAKLGWSEDITADRIIHTSAIIEKSTTATTPSTPTTPTPTTTTTTTTTISRKKAKIMTPEERKAAKHHDFLVKNMFKRYCKGNTLLHIYSEAGNASSALALVRLGANVNVRSWIAGRQLTPLSVCAQANHGCAVARILLESGKCDVNAVNTFGDTALHFAAWRGKTQFCDLLLDYDADINAGGDEANFTPLHGACHRNHLETALLLISRGANAEAICLGYEDEELRLAGTPFDLCEDEHMRELVVKAYEKELNWRRRKAFLMFGSSIKNADPPWIEKLTDKVLNNRDLFRLIGTFL